MEVDEWLHEQQFTKRIHNIEFEKGPKKEQSSPSPLMYI